MTLTAKITLWALLSVLALTTVKAHEVHDHGVTVNYHNWVNNEGKGCCNNQDCRPLPANYERISNGTHEVFVEGEGVAEGQKAWCPVLAKHYLSRGNAPDGSRAHYCVWYANGSTPCEQLLCYQPPTLH